MEKRRREELRRQKQQDKKQRRDQRVAERQKRELEDGKDAELKGIVPRPQPGQIIIPSRRKCGGADLYLRVVILAKS
jgi:hypothetical protein